MQCFALQLMRFPQRGAWSRVLHVDIFKYSQRVRERCREENRKQEKALLEGLSCPVWGDWSSVHGFVVKNLPALQEIWVWSPGQENSWRMEWQPTPVFLSGESHGQRSLEGYNPWGSRVGHDWSDSACTHARRQKTCTLKALKCWWKKLKVTLADGEIYHVLDWVNQ